MASYSHGEPLNVGDRIKFKAATRDSYKAVWRKVNGFWGTTGMPTVAYNGWADFAVRISEVLEVERVAP